MRIRVQARGKKNLVGQRVEALRKKQGMRQKELLQLLQERGVEINASGLSKLEGQYRGVSDFELVALAEIFGMTVDALLHTP